MRRDDDHAVGRVEERLVLLVPAHTVVLMLGGTKHLDDLSPS